MQQKTRHSLKWLKGVTRLMKVDRLGDKMNTQLFEWNTYMCHVQRKYFFSDVPSAVKATFMSVTFDSVLWLHHTQILELCSKFHVSDVGFIVALLRWDYSYQLQLIIQELVLETKQYLEICIHQCHISFLSTIGSHHWPLIEIFNWVFDIISSIHIQDIVIGYLGNQQQQWWSPSH